MNVRERAVGRLLALSAAGGLVAAGVALPVVGGAGLFARAATDSFSHLPADFKAPPPPQRSRIVEADGSTLGQFYAQDRISLPLRQISQTMQNAVIAIEDARFFQHGAIDLKGTLRAAATDFGHGGTVQGGSTLTQQYVKNVLLTQGEKQASTDTLGRKVREARYAIALERRLTKQQILDRYLNIVYFGQGAYGIEAAAERYFGVHARDLDAAQSALLAGLVQSPSAYDPVRAPQAATARRNLVLSRMAQLHLLAPADARAAAATPVRVRLRPLPFGCEMSVAPFYCDWVHTQLLADPHLGRTPQEREQRLLTGGLTVRTTLRPQVQTAAQHAVMRVVPMGSRVATAVDVVQPGTGAVLGMAVDRRYGSNRRRHETRVNLAVGGQSGFQAGSTFKMFTLAAAIQEHVPLSQTFDSPPQVHLSGFRGCGGSSLGSWAPHNAEDGEGGTFGLVRATWESVNTYFAQLERKVGVCRPWYLAKKMGIREVATGKAVAQVPAFTLGVADTSPLQVAAAYATLAARGRFCAPYVISSITDASGRVLERSSPSCHRVMSTHVADTVTSILRGVIQGPDPKRTGATAGIGRPVAGKTGTTDSFAAAWFTGFTPQIAASVWVGDPRGGAQHPLRNVRVAGQFYSHVYGADLPASVWRATMIGALRGVPARNFLGTAASILHDSMSSPHVYVRRTSPPAVHSGGGGGHGHGRH